MKQRAEYEYAKFEADSYHANTLVYIGQFNAKDGDRDPVDIEDSELEAVQNDADKANTLSMDMVTLWRLPKTLTPLITTCTISLPRTRIVHQCW